MGIVLHHNVKRSGVHSPCVLLPPGQAEPEELHRGQEPDRVGFLRPQLAPNPLAGQFPKLVRSRISKELGWKGVLEGGLGRKRVRSHLLTPAPP